MASKLVAEDGASNGVRDRSPVRLWSVESGVGCAGGAQVTNAYERL
jgi:hypothetical protein